MGDIQRWPLPRQGALRIPGEPVSASRPRVVRGKGQRPRAIYPDAHVAWEARAALLLRSWWGARPSLVGPVGLELVLVHERPACWTPREVGGALSLAGARDLAVMVGTDHVYGRIPAWTCPKDVDNVAKLVMDALTKARVMADDRQVVSLSVLQLWAAVQDEDGPHVGVRLFGRSG